MSRMERVEKDRGIDIALVVRAVDGRPIEWQVLSADDPETDAGQRQAEPHANVTEDVQQALPSKQDRQQHPGGCDDENVSGDRDVGGG